MAHLRALIKKAGRKSYTVCVGKLNPAKLGNFAEVQAWVLVACPEGSLVDSKVRLVSSTSRTTILKSVQEFPAPIVTPYELQLALAPEPEWTGRYVFDFGTLLAEGAETPRAAEAEGKDDDDHDDGDRPHFSLVTGKFQYSKRPDSGPHGSFLLLYALTLPSAHIGSSYIEKKALESSTDVILRNQDNALSTIGSAAGMSSNAPL
jgi:diphthamide biosynthesis protein 2